VIEDVTAPLAPVVGDLTAPLAPIVEGVTAPLTPVIEDLTAPLAPVVEDLTGPLAPVVGDLTSPLPPSAGDVSAGVIGVTGPSSPAPHAFPTAAAPSSQIPAPSAPPATPGAPSASVFAGPEARSGLGLDAPQTSGRESMPAAPGPGPSIFGSPGLFSPSTPSSHAGSASPLASATGSVPPNGPSLPVPSGASAGSGAGGVATGTLLALLLSLAAFGLRHFSRLRMASFAWRPQAFVAVIERPG
jgi:hypothetical protein